MQIRSVTREEYGAVARNLPIEWAREVAWSDPGGFRYAGIQWVDPESNRVVAQAVYGGTRVRQYWVRGEQA